MQEAKKKSSPIIRAMLGFIGLSIGVSGAVGIYFIVQAVSPGSVKNPAFSPQNDDVKLAVECVSGKMLNGATLSLDTSTLGSTLTASNVIAQVDPITLKCNDTNGWYMTGCSMFCSGAQANDESMPNQNECQGTSCSGGTPSLYIRCCRYAP